MLIKLNNTEIVFNFLQHNIGLQLSFSTVKPRKNNNIKNYNFSNNIIVFTADSVTESCLKTKPSNTNTTFLQKR
jgi:hypothetical protein